MATVYGSYSAGWKPSGADEYRKYRAFLVYSVSETNTAVTITAYSGVNLNYSVTKDGYTAQMAIGTNSYSATGSTTYGSSKTVTFISSRSITYQKSTSPYTVNVYGRVKCTTDTGKGGWTGAWSTASVTITIPAISYSITYDANGGVNAPSAQSHVHDASVTLASSVPTRASYDFVEWNTASDGSGTSYDPGDTFSTNANTTLYAQWELSYVPPKIDEFRAYRVLSNTGYNPTPATSGEMSYMDFKYTAPVSGTLTGITVLFGSASGTVGTSGNYKYAYSASGHLPGTSSETVRVTINCTDKDGNSYSYTYDTYISSEAFVFDAYKGAQNSEEYQSFAIGGMARDFDSSARSSNGNFDCYMDADFKEDVTAEGDLNVAGDTNVTGNANITGTLNGFDYGQNKVLWTGASYMNASQTQTLSEKISEQEHGVVLAWSGYSSGAAQNYDWVYIFVPKWHVLNNNGAGIDMNMSTNSGSAFCSKYVYVADDHITGHASNTVTGAKTNGITYTNTYWVLRAVLGV